MTDWNDNAKAAVREFANYIGQSDKCERYLKAFETKKTVADAVEFCKGLWPIYACDNIHYDHETGHYFCNDEPKPHYQLVCTHEQFEACVKEQEGEKWTHVVDGVTKCIVLSTHGETSWVLEEGDVYETYFSSCIKPIKPTISKAEAWDKLKDLPANEWSIHSHVMELENKYDII